MLLSHRGEGQLGRIDPNDVRLDGVLYVRQEPDRPVSDDEVQAWLRSNPWAKPDNAARALRHVRLQHELKWRLISGGALCSQAGTPFALDGAIYPSVRAFYDGLKPGGRRGRADATFAYQDQTIAVGSVAHLQLIARAVMAKVAAHPYVRGELAQTGRARLMMGGPNSQPLGRVMPFALMIERLRIAS